MIMQPFIIRVYDFATTLFNRYKARVLADSGTVKNDAFTTEYYKMCQANDMQKSIQFAWLGSAGSKFRTSGIYTFFTKIYSLLGGNDATQTTSTSQPYLSGNIAPNEKLGLKNPNGGSNFMTHPAISFGASDSWSVTTVLNWNGGNSALGFIFGSTAVSKTRCYINQVDGKVVVFNEAGDNIAFNSLLLTKIGKGAMITLSYNTGNLSLYVNGIIIESKPIVNNFVFGSIITVGTDSRYFYGKIHAHIIRSQALTQQQVTAEYNLLRSYIPEIESVVIGTQTWATSNCEMAATPQGNVIAEVQAAGNVEKVVNGTNLTDTNADGLADNFSTLSNSTISNSIVTGNGFIGNAQRISKIATGSYCRLYQVIVTTTNKWYKLDFYYRSNQSLGVSINNNANYYYSIPSNTGDAIKVTIYLQQPFSVGSELLFQLTTSNSAWCEVGNVSVQEIGWSVSQGLYDGIYAQTAGTIEQKTYAAVKAAAMWRSPNNDVALAAVYGKIYNKFAALLLKMDIAYYNTANPTALWGWKMPLRAELTTLSSIGGNAAKVGGVNQWTTANGTNTSGLTMLGSGYINAAGSFVENKLSALMLCSDDNFARKINDADNTFDEVSVTLEGGVIRLIKA